MFVVSILRYLASSSFFALACAVAISVVMRSAATDSNTFSLCAFVFKKTKVFFLFRYVAYHSSVFHSQRSKIH
jgi:hypothetical protein